MTHQITIKLADKPSNSKGWARYKMSSNGTAVVASNTGNEWISSSKDADVQQGQILDLTAQVMLRVGKTSREEISAKRFQLIAADGESCVIEFKPGSQGIRLQITGAKLA